MTTPIPPGTYDPCNGNTPRPLEVVFNKGTRLMVVAPTPCDGGGIGGGTGNNPANTKLNIITNNFDIYDINKQNYLLNNQPVFFAFNDYVLNNGTSSENKAFLDWAVGYLMENPNVSLNDFKNVFLVDIMT